MRLLLVSLFLVRTAAAGVCTIPLTSSGASFVTPVSIGSGPPLRFLVDTGATRTVVETRIGVQPSRSLTAVTTTGTIRTGEATVSLQAGAITAELPVLIADLPRFPSHGHIDGILGMDVVAGHSFLIGGRCLQVDASEIEGRALESEEIVGRVAIHLNGLRFILDSGASFVVLTSARSHRLAADGGSFQMISASGAQSTRSATVCLFGQDVDAALVDGVDEREDGLLPLSMFSRVWVSADRRKVRVVPTR